MRATYYFISLAACISLSVTVFAHEHDTLKCHFASASPHTYMLYTSGNGGYICGNNGSGDMEIAQKFGQAASGDSVGTECSVPDGHQLNEVLIWFGTKRVANPNDSVYINVYGINHVTGDPGTLLGTSFPKSIGGVNGLDTSSVDSIYTDFLMQLPIVFTDSFFISVVLPKEAGDTLGIISSTTGQALGSKLCWVKNSSSDWSSLLAAHAFDVDAVIFPEVGDVPEGISEQSSPLTGLNAFPNPCSNNTVIMYSISKPVQHLEFTLSDAMGKVIYAFTVQETAPGKHEFNVDTGALPAGIYLYSLESQRKKYNGKLAIIK